MLNAADFETHWIDIRAQVRPHWQALTEAEVDWINGDIDTLIELLEEKYGYSWQMAEDQVSRLLEA